MNAKTAYKLINHKHPHHNRAWEPRPINYSRLADAKEDQAQYGGEILRMRDKAMLVNGAWVKPFGHGKLQS